MVDLGPQEKDEFMQYYNQYRPLADRNQNTEHRFRRSVLGGLRPGSEGSSYSSHSSSTRDSSTGLPMHRKLIITSKSLGRDPRLVDLENTYRRLDQNDSHSTTGYYGEVRAEDTLSRDSGNSSGGTPEANRRAIIRHNSYPSPCSTTEASSLVQSADPLEYRFSRLDYPARSVRQLDTVSLQSGRAPSTHRSSFDSLSLRSLDAHLQGWSPLAEEFRPRLSAKRKFESFDEEPEPAETSSSKRCRTPDIQDQVQEGFCSQLLWKTVKMIFIALVLVAMLLSSLLLYELVRTYQCSNSARLRVDIEGLEERLKRDLYGQHIAQKEIVAALEEFLEKPVNEQGPKPILVLILVGWLGGGKTFTSNLIGQSFPSNIHSLLGSSLLSTSLADIHRTITRSCGYSLLILDDVDTGVEQGLANLERFLVSLASEEESQTNGTLVVLSTNTGGHTINKYMLEKARSYFNSREQVDGDEIRSYLKDQDVKIPLYSFLLEYSIPVVLVPFLPLTREHVRSCITAELRDNGASMSGKEINHLLDQVQFFSQDFPVFSKTGCKKISSKVSLALGEHLDL